MVIEFWLRCRVEGKHPGKDTAVEVYFVFDWPFPWLPTKDCSIDFGCILEADHPLFNLENHEIDTEDAVFRVIYEPQFSKLKEELTVQIWADDIDFNAGRDRYIEEEYDLWNR